MNNNGEITFNFDKSEDVKITHSNDGIFNIIDVRLANDSGEEVTIVKIDNSDELGMRVMVYPNPDTDLDQLVEVSLHNYQNENPVTLTESERAIAIDRVNDIYQDSFETIDLVMLEGHIGINNLSDNDLLEILDMKSVEEFRENHGVDA